MLVWVFKIIFIFSIGIHCQAMDLSGKLLGLQGNLGNLKGKLGRLKRTLGKLKDGLEGKVPLDHSLEQRLLPQEFYGADGEKTALAIQEKIRKIAEDVGYGYKTANLMELQDVCDLVNKMIQKNTRYSFAVPAFAQISSQQIQAFLSNQLLDVANLWQKLVTEKFPSGQIDLTAAIQNKQFPDGFLDGAKAIEDEIKSKFNSLVIGGQELENIIPDLDVNQKQNLEKLLVEVTKKNEKCMVRSTGKEDTDKLANAGGNESIANVSPQTKNLLDAIRDVVASYFSAKSLTQRLGAGDRSIIDDPFTPVVMQRMIGEKEGMPLPRCGVMFTEETEGAQSKIFRKNEHGHFIDANDVNVVDDDIQTKARYRDENYKIRTSGITVIQAAFGHNEGVVNSIVPVDTYYIENSVMLIHPIIKEKFFRIAPIDEGKLGRKDNAPALAKEPVLEPDAVIALKLFANALEDYYKKPMDVEYVILDEGGIKTIYIVQARPIVHNPYQPEPCYLDFDHDDLKSLEKNRGQAIGVGGGTLQFMESKNNLVIKRTIGEALTAYQGNKNPQEIKSIFINEMAPATSHEATTFRSELKPVVSFENDFEKLEAWSSVEPANLILDAQQQTVIKWPGGDFDLASFEKAKRALKGWINYPLPQQVSVVKSYLPNKESDVYKTVNQLFFKADTPPKDKVSGLVDALRSKARGEAVIFLRQQIKEVKTADQVTAENALKNIWLFFHTLPRFVGYKNNWQNLLTYVGVIILNLQNNLSIGQEHSDYLGKRLFLIHFLETLLFQQYNDATGLHGVSAIKLWSQMRLEKKGTVSATTDDMSGMHVPKDEYARLAGVLAEFCLTDNIGGEWGFFVNHLGTTGKSAEEIFLIEKLTKQRDALNQQVAILDKPLKIEKKPGLKAALQKDLEEVETELDGRSLTDDDKIKAKFYQMLKMLGELDMLELWVNTSFAKKLSAWGHQDYDQILEQVVQEAEKAKDFLKTLLDYKKRIQAVNVAGFENPATFLKNWKDFQDNILTYFVGDGENDFIKSFVGIFDTQYVRQSFYPYNVIPQIEKKPDTGTNDLGKLAALGVMEELITQFDTAIKAVTGSTQFGVYAGGLEGKAFDTIKNDQKLLNGQVVTKKDKIFTFHLMLERYLELLQKWYDLSIDDSIVWTEYFGCVIKNVLNGYGYEYSIPRILLNLKNKTANSDELNADLHIAGAIIGTKITFDRVYPKTHEEIFTFIHQSLLMVIIKFLNKYGISVNYFPQDLKKIHAAILAIAYNSKKPSLVGAHFKGNVLELKYNFPQQNHSATIKLVYNIKTKHKELIFSMFGIDHNARWEKSIDCMEYDRLVNNHSVKTAFLLKGYEASWDLSDKDPLLSGGWLCKMIVFLCDVAQNFDNNDRLITSHFSSLENNPVIDFCAQYHRIHLFFERAFNAIWNKKVYADTLLTILSRLFQDKDYLFNTEIFLYRLYASPEVANPSYKKGEREIFYAKQDTFYNLVKTDAGYNDFGKYASMIIEALFDLSDNANLTKEQSEKFYEVIRTNDLMLEVYLKNFFQKQANELIGTWSSSINKIVLKKITTFIDVIKKNEVLLHAVQDAVFNAMIEVVRIGFSWPYKYKHQWLDQSNLQAIIGLKQTEKNLLKELVVGALKRKDSETKNSLLTETKGKWHEYYLETQQFIRSLLQEAGLDVSSLGKF